MLPQELAGYGKSEHRRRKPHPRHSWTEHECRGVDLPASRRSVYVTVVRRKAAFHGYRPRTPASRSVKHTVEPFRSATCEHTGPQAKADFLEGMAATLANRPKRTPKASSNRSRFCIALAPHQGPRCRPSLGSLHYCAQRLDLLRGKFMMLQLILNSLRVGVPTTTGQRDRI